MDAQQVDIPGVGLVEFPDSMSADDVNAAAKRLHDEANKPKDQGFVGGLMNTVPTPSKIMGFIRSIPENIQRSIHNDALTHPEENQNTPIGKVFNGRPYEGAGELTGILGQAALGEAVPRIVRGRMAPTEPPQPAPHLDRSIPVRPSELTSEQLQERLFHGTGTPTPRPPRYAARPSPGRLETAGSGPVAPTAAPEAAATPTPAPPAQPQLPASWQQFVQPEDLPTQSGPAPTQSGQGPFAPGIRVLTPKATPTSWTPEAARARLEMNDWHSGATPGTPEAAQMSGLHKFDAELKSRMAHQLANQNGNITASLLTKMGMIPARYGAAAWSAKQAGLPGWAGAAGMAGIDAVRANPVLSAEMLRAALLANLAGGNSATPDQQ